MEIRNIKFRQFLKLKDPELVKQYDDLLKYLNPKDTLSKKKIKDFQKMSYGDVSDAKRLEQDGTWDSIMSLLSLSYGISMHSLLNTRIVDVYASINCVKGIIKTLIQREVTHLCSKNNQNLENAGIKNMDKFGDLNVVIPIAEKLAVTPQDVMTWEYQIVFTFALYYTEYSKIQKNYADIINKANLN